MNILDLLKKTEHNSNPTQFVVCLITTSQILSIFMSQFTEVMASAILPSVAQPSKTQPIITKQPITSANPPDETGFPDFGFINTNSTPPSAGSYNENTDYKYPDTDSGSHEDIIPTNNTTPTTGTKNLSALSVVCDIRNGLGQVNLSKLPPGCTAAATSHNNISVVDQMTNGPRSVPFLLYYNGFSYSEWGEFLAFPNGFVNLMISEHFDGIIFNNMYSENFINPDFDQKRNEQMYRFFSRLKQLNPNALYGLGIPGHAEILPTAFNYNLLDSVIDFYVIKTINYRKCEYRGIMSRTTTAGDMRKSLKNLNESVPKTKILLTVQLYAEGVTFNSKYDVLTYSELCGGKKLSRSRKYCKDSLKSLSKKASLRNEFGMLGVYVKYVDYDDVEGLCHCDNGDGDYTFPGLAAIISGSQQTNKVDLGCSDFGNLYHN